MSLDLIKGGKIITLFLLILFYSFPGSIIAEFNSTLSGIVIDAETSKPVSEAVIELIEKEVFVTTRPDGKFFIADLAGGSYHLKVRHIAYKEYMVTYDFNENNQKQLVIYLEPKSIEISTVIISGLTVKSKFDEYYEDINVLKGKELQHNLGLTLASTLKNETGLAIRSMGPAPARPVIRGLSGDRVLISEDGIKTNDLSATSPDHAVTVEPFSVNRIEVMRGPKTLIQTSNTFGGIVNVVRHEIPVNYHDNIWGCAGLYAESVNKGYLGSFNAEVPISKYLFRLEGSRRKSNDLVTPIGTLFNSNSEVNNFSGGGSYINDFGYAGLSYRDYQLSYGIPGGFIGAHPKGVDIDIQRRQWNFKSRINLPLAFIGNAELNFSRAYYRHKEYESNGSIGSEFRIINYAGAVNFDQKNTGIINEGIIGVSFEYRDLDIGGRVFTSPAGSFNLAAYIYENLSAGKFNFEIGARYGYDAIDPEKKNENAKIGNVRKRIFNTFSLSFSVLYPLTDIVSVGANLSRSTRVPTIEELFSEGPHLAAYSYEVGNPDLNAETGIGAELFVYHKFKSLNFAFNLFRNQIDNYIIPRNTGETNYSTFLPIYASSGNNALMYGFEGQIDWNVDGNFYFSSSLSYTRGIFSATGKPIPQIPPLKMLLEFKYQTENFSVGINSEMADGQNLVDEFEEATAGHMVAGLFVQYSFSTGNIIHNFSAVSENVFDKEYRNHLSRVKSIMPEAGRNIRLTYKLYFNL